METNKANWKINQGQLHRPMTSAVTQHPAPCYSFIAQLLQFWNSLINVEKGAPYFYSVLSAANYVASPDSDYAGRRKLWGKRHH